LPDTRVASSHQTGSGRDQQQRRLPEAQTADDDRTLMEHQEDAHHGEVDGGGAKGEADRHAAA
jgi:hypothetical protein